MTFKPAVFGQFTTVAVWHTAGMVESEKKLEEHCVVLIEDTLGPLGGGGCEGAVALLGELPPPHPLRLKQDAATSKTNKPTITEILLFMRSELTPESVDIRGLLNPVLYYFDIICADKGNTGAQEK